MPFGRSRTAVKPSDRTRRDALSGVTAFVQPVMNLGSGRVVGFEALARLRDGDRLLAPAQFLPALSDDQRVALFREMLSQAGAFIKAARVHAPHLSVSVNVESSLLLRDDLCDLIGSVGAVGDADAPALYVELLEGERVVDFDAMVDTLTRLKRMRIGIALDDVGSAYSSLTMIKRLPIDVIKLDQAFARELRRKPEDLQFVHSLMSLARGVGKRLVVEGVETADIWDALATIGVELGQGYGIARPMPVDQAGRWLADHVPVGRGRTPRSMLGAYAAHLNIVETCRVLKGQALPIDWRVEMMDPHVCVIGRYFDRLGVHDTPYGVAHKRFHAVIDRFDTDATLWEAAAQRFRDELRAAILAEAGPIGAGGVVTHGTGCGCALALA